MGVSAWVRAVEDWLGVLWVRGMQVPIVSLFVIMLLYYGRSEMELKRVEWGVMFFVWIG